MAEQVAERRSGAPAGQTGGYQDRWWIPRFWVGINVTGWWGLLWRNRFAVHPSRWGMAAILTMTSLLNSFLWLVQEVIYGRRIARTELVDDPIFIIGHWRSGTTLLHELLVLDPRHTYPDTYCCFGPNAFLVSRWFFERFLWFLMPSRRPMDNMPAGFDRPQEDEFALCNMGARSPYLTMIFPNRPPQDQEYFDLERLDPARRARWKAAFLWFLKCLTVRTPKRIVLKSPPHTFRIRVLLEMFPRARFLHIVRDPMVLFPSTVNLWRRLHRDEALQVPTHEGLEEYVFETFARMYEVFERDKALIPAGQFCEVRYEELVRDPEGHLRRVYEELSLGDFEAVRPALERFLAEQKDYKKNRYDLSPELRAEIARRWGFFIERYGYATEPTCP